MTAHEPREPEREADAATELDRELAGTDDLSGKAQNACFMAMAEAKRGNLEEATKFLQAARQHDGTCFLIERAERAIRVALPGGPGSAIIATPTTAPRKNPANAPITSAAHDKNPSTPPISPASRTSPNPIPAG